MFVGIHVHVFFQLRPQVWSTRLYTPITPISLTNEYYLINRLLFGYYCRPGGQLTFGMKIKVYEQTF